MGNQNMKMHYSNIDILIVIKKIYKKYELSDLSASLEIIHHIGQFLLPRKYLSWVPAFGDFYHDI